MLRRFYSNYVGKSGGEIFNEMMSKHNVKHIFGYPGIYIIVWGSYPLGGAILPVFDAIHNSNHFDLILPRHEQGKTIRFVDWFCRRSRSYGWGVLVILIFLIIRYARVTGKTGVVLVTSGPGATNVLFDLVWFI